MAMNCLRADALLDDYSRATTKYFEAADKLSNFTGSHDQFAMQNYATE
jgi:hypothetical protein